ncbi:Hypothetical protein A7982_08519 [Minicystis rosea]|nr:Hypothetical protein A7982_08519 [Minicystis rosea]
MSTTASVSPSRALASATWVSEELLDGPSMAVSSEQATRAPENMTKSDPNHNDCRIEYLR